jgi:hypothetical protein
MLRPSRRRVIQCAASGTLLLAGPVIAADSSINETGYVKIGGIDQWATIRGANSHNPAILFLHGGPGEAQSPFLNQFIPWEEDFIIANWDQRGAGKPLGGTAFRRRT